MSNFMDDFESVAAAIETVADDFEGDAQNAFIVDNDQKAEWVMAKIREEREEATRMTALCDAQISLYTERKAKTEERTAKRVARLTSLLEGYFDTVPHKATKTQDSYTLATGKLIRKRQNPKIDIDDDALLAWAKENAPDFVETKEKVKWGDLKKVSNPYMTESAGMGCYVTYGGEIIEGVTLTALPDIFSVKTEV